MPKKTNNFLQDKITSTSSSFPFKTIFFGNFWFNKVQNSDEPITMRFCDMNWMIDWFIFMFQMLLLFSDMKRWKKNGNKRIRARYWEARVNTQCHGMKKRKFHLTNKRKKRSQIYSLLNMCMHISFLFSALSLFQ